MPHAQKQKLHQVLCKRKNLIWVFSFFAFVIIVLLATLGFFHISKFKKSNLVICHLMSENFINKLDDDLFEECLDFTKNKTYFKQQEFMRDINLWLSSFGVSHLYLYNSAENKKMWEGIGHETGILAKQIFGNWIVTEVHNPYVDVMVGDILLRINNQKIMDAQQILTSGGEFLIVRDGERKRVSIEIRQIAYSENMKVKSINQEWTYLKVPTFKSDFFDYENLDPILQELSGKSLVLDLRGNLGGNYVSILRLLSGLICEEKRVGKIYNKRVAQDSEYDLENNLNDAAQILTVTQHNPIYLKTFASKNCKPVKKMIAITNEKSASVTELLVALLKKNIKNFKSYGTRTAGHMLLAIWYPIEELGGEVMMSIPYAWSTDLEEDVLEGIGVAPTENIETDQLIQFQGSHDPLLDYILDEIKSDLRAKEL